MDGARLFDAEASVIIWCAGASTWGTYKDKNYETAHPKYSAPAPYSYSYIHSPIQAYLML
jgi:hypothetical protein